MKEKLDPVLKARMEGKRRALLRIVRRVLLERIYSRDRSYIQEWRVKVEHRDMNDRITGLLRRSTFYF